MEDFTSYFQKLLKQPVELSSNDDMELLNNYSHQVLNDQPLGPHVHGGVDYSTGIQFSLAGNSGTQGLFCPFDQGNTHLAQSLPSIQGLQRQEKSAMPMSDFVDIPSSSAFGSEYGGNRKSDDRSNVSLD